MPTNKELLDFIDRRHPEYADHFKQWLFMQATYDGGREWFENNIFTYYKEGKSEYAERVGRAYRFNHTREVVDLIGKYIFKSAVSRNVEDAPEAIKSFWKAVGLQGMDIDRFANLVCRKTSIKGRIWVFVDSTKSPDVVSVADEKETQSRIYAYIVNPEDVLDLAYADDGSLSWIKVREYKRDDADPLASSGEVRENFRLWTKTSWTLFTVKESIGGTVDDRVVEVLATGENALGFIPAFPADHIISDDVYTTPGLVNDIAYLDRAVANYLSSLDAIIQDQTFSQLAIPIQAITSEDDTTAKAVEAGTKRVFTYDGEGGMKPEYLSPDPSQAQIILQVVEKIINEIYHTVGAAGERTKQDNSVGIDNSSGVAKAYDFERLNSLLTMKAQCLQAFERKLIRMVCEYASINEPTDDLVTYPETFDVRMLADEFAIAQELAGIQAPIEIRRLQMGLVRDKLFPQISKADRAKTDAGIKNWSGVPIAPQQLTDQGFIPNQDAGGKPATADSRQGQVTGQTGKAAA